MISDGSSDDDEDYDAFADGHVLVERRYPIHDACEFEDVEILQRLIFVPVGDNNSEDDDDDEDPARDKHAAQYTSSSSSSDENDSTAAAHAAAIGHSPLPRHKCIDGGDADLVAGELSMPDMSEPMIDMSKIDSTQPSDKQGEPKTPTASNTSTVEERDLAMDTGVDDAATAKKEEEKAGEGKEVETAEGDMLRKSTAMDVEPDSENATPAAESEEPAAATVNGEELSPKTSSKIDESKPAKPKDRMYRVPTSSSLNERDDDENTALHLAIHARKLEHVKLLLQVGASFRMKCDGSWPIHTAISMGAIKKNQQFAYDCVVALHGHGADLTAKDDSNHSPLFLACMFNLSQIASYILADDDGLSSLNARADRVGNRPLHAAAKFDTLENAMFSRSAAAIVTGNATTAQVTHRRLDDSIVNSVRSAPAFSGKLEASRAASAAVTTQTIANPLNEAILTQVLLGTPGIEVDAPNATGQTALHIACMRGNWPVARLLLQAGASSSCADRRGFTPGQLAHKRGMPIPNDLVEQLGDPPESGLVPPFRDLIVDPNGSTLVMTHELCLLHRTCPPMRRDSSEPPPENVRRLHVLVDADTGILRSGEFGGCAWKQQARRAAMADVLKIHDYRYVETISALVASVPDIPNAIAHIDPDTAVSRWSFEAALRAAGSVCEAVDHVVAGDYRNSFCAVRPPGHHAGPRGIVRCANDPEGGSHGFCLLNNVAIGAAYARSMYRNEGIKKVAIIDFDVHHGNGTEEIIRQLVPLTERSPIRMPFIQGELLNSSYRPWLDETDIENVFFASTHGYGNRGVEQPGVFYPASGKTHTSEAIAHPALVDNPNVTDFLFSQTWARMGDESRANCCKIINVGLSLPEDQHDGDHQGRSMKQRLDLRDTYRTKILPYLREFDPDIIFISAGFDAHRKDTMNFGYVGMVEEDYEWVTEQLVKIANTCCNGRIVSVLEGGYKIHGGIVSPFARSVASHVRALVDGGRSRELYDAKDAAWESQYERHFYERRERKKEEERERLRLMQDATRNAILAQMAEQGEAPEDPDAPPSRKRRRNQVDYKELFKQMQHEGFAG